MRSGRPSPNRCLADDLVQRGRAQRLGQRAGRRVMPSQPWAARARTHCRIRIGARRRLDREVSGASVGLISTRLKLQAERWPVVQNLQRRQVDRVAARSRPARSAVGHRSSSASRCAPTAVAYRRGFDRATPRCRRTRVLHRAIGRGRWSRDLRLLAGGDLVQIGVSTATCRLSVGDDGLVEGLSVDHSGNARGAGTRSCRWMSWCGRPARRKRRGHHRA